MVQDLPYVLIRGATHRDEQLDGSDRLGPSDMRKDAADSILPLLRE